MHSIFCLLDLFRYRVIVHNVFYSFPYKKSFETSVMNIIQVDKSPTGFIFTHHSEYRENLRLRWAITNTSSTASFVRLENSVFLSFVSALLQTRLEMTDACFTFLIFSAMIMAVVFPTLHVQSNWYALCLDRLGKTWIPNDPKIRIKFLLSQFQITVFILFYSISILQSCLESLKIILYGIFQIYDFRRCLKNENIRHNFATHTFDFYASWNNLKIRT